MGAGTLSDRHFVRRNMHRIAKPYLYRSEHNQFVGDHMWIRLELCCFFSTLLGNTFFLSAYLELVWVTWNKTSHPPYMAYKIVSAVLSCLIADCYQVCCYFLLPCSYVILWPCGIFSYPVSWWLYHSSQMVTIAPRSSLNPRSLL